MVTDAEILAKIDEAILNVTTELAAGNRIIEVWEGPIKIKKSSPEELLKTLREMRSIYAAGAMTETDRRPGCLFYGGRQ
jgi:hypothetical protein